MAITQKFQFEELDAQSRDYLVSVRDRAGRGMPGLYVPLRNYLPMFALILGAIIVAATIALAANLVVEEPLGVAMLETAGLLLGGWLILYAVRVMRAAKSADYAGHFVYADAQTLWECAGTTVTVTDVSHVTKAFGHEEFSKEGNYLHTAVSIRTNNGRRVFKLANKDGAADLMAFLNALAWLRDGGNAEERPASRGHGPATHQDLPAPIMACVAKTLIETDEMPRDLSPEAFGLEVTEVPWPKQEGHASFGLLGLLLIVGFATLSVFVFKSLNVGWRDEAVWNHIEQIDDEDRRVPWLRAYLADERNTEHRDEARQMLSTIYADAIGRIRAGFIQRQKFADPKPHVNAPADPRIDRELLDGLAVVLKSLAELPSPLVSVSVHEKGENQPGAAERERVLMHAFTLALLQGVGEELVEFVKSPSDPGMIEIVYEYEPPTAVGRGQFRVDFSFRKTGGGGGVTTATCFYETNSRTPDVLQKMGQELGQKTAGSKKTDFMPVES